MKSKLYLIPLFLLLFFVSACKKWLPENRIVGTWRLVDAEKKRLFSTDGFTTGYEDGLFVFNENGTASYSDPSMQLDGTWSMRNVGGGYYDSDNNWHDNARTVFLINLYNFPANQVLNLSFDRVDFRNGGRKMFAFIDGRSYTYRYDFRKQ